MYTFLQLIQFSSVQLLSHDRLFVIPWITARQASLFITISQSSPGSCPLSLWCHPAISSLVVPFSSCPQSLPASESSKESTLPMRWPKYWSFSFSIIPSKEIPGLISFRMDWLDLLAVQESSPTPQFKSINSLAPQPSSQSNSHIHTWPQEKP